MRAAFYIMLFILGTVTASCRRVIDIGLQNTSPLLVIEGNLSNIQGTQTISITKTVNFSNNNVYPAVTGAKVSISGFSAGAFTFKETKPGQYTGTLRGRPGQTYTLNVQVDGQTYTATSTMPNNVMLDSLGISALEVGKKVVKTVSAFYRDPSGEKNQYRFIMHVNGIQVKNVFATDDYLSNGRYINTSLYQDDITLKTGDKVEVEMQCIDTEVYNYFYNLSKQGGNSPNNSATPSNPTSNISNGALGYFSAYTMQRKSITVL